jgi:hypothetical protein
VRQAETYGVGDRQDFSITGRRSGVMIGDSVPDGLLHAELGKLDVATHLIVGRPASASACADVICTFLCVA